jgi:Flp pilus assembly protein TadG
MEPATMIEAWRRVTASSGRLRKRESGAVEFAILVPVLLVFLTGTAQFGITLTQSAMLTNAVAIGAQLFSISRGTTPTPYTSTVSAIGAAAPTAVGQPGQASGGYSGVVNSVSSATKPARCH